jgi:ligand-binding sensor domain-containing protein
MVDADGGVWGGQMKVLIIGWAEDDFMTGAIMEMDKGLVSAAPHRIPF